MNDDIQNDLLIRELEESVKQDRLNKLWKDYGSYIIGGAVIIVLATGFFSFYGSYTAKANAHNTRVMLEARESGDGAAAELTDVAAESGPGQRVLALLMAAGLYVEDGAYDKAVRAYKDIAEDKAVPPLYRDLGEVLAVRTEWGFVEDKPEASQLLARLEPVIANRESPWRWHAMVQAALIAAHGQSDYKAARDYLKPVREQDDLPPSLQERARALDHVFSMELSETHDDAGKDRPKGTEAGRG